jgi:hypothetical protein
VVSERWPRFAAAFFVTDVFGAVLGAHVVEGLGNGGVATLQDMVCRQLPRMRVLAARSTVQARARSDSRKSATTKAGVLGTVRVTPLPARVLTGPEMFKVTRRRQGRRDLVACSWDCHGDGWARVGGAVVVRQRVALGLIYPNARG